MKAFIKKIISIKFAARALAVAALALLLFWLALGLWPNPLAETPAGWDYTVKITDRHGRLLKEFLPPKTVRREEMPLAAFSPHLINAVLAAEDKRFYSHLGVDPAAALRAAYLNVKNGQIISGASTITMQVARLNQGLAPGPRTFERKFKEIWWALLIERHNNKERILTEYLNRAPCGNLTEGFPAAARLYLNKTVDKLSPSEAAFLAALPAAPGALNPYKDPRPALKRRAGIVKKMAALGHLSPDEESRALAEPLALTREKPPFEAPHFVNHIKNTYLNGPEAPPAEIKTTIDLRIQARLEDISRETVERFKNQGLDQTAIVVLSLPEREVLAWVGSGDFFNEKSGQNDGVTARRQPGSALKPFLYAAAIEGGVINAATLLDDRPAEYVDDRGGVFNPTNYSGNYHGPVSARVALASSLNLPAVKLTEELGVTSALNKLRLAGLNLTQDANHYGLSLALGAGEVNLLALTNAYGVLADQGELKPVKVILPDNETTEEVKPTGVFSREAAFIVTDILRDPRARSVGFGRGGVLETYYPSAVKTGTSKNFRDNWCVGYTTDFVVGVWAGNFEASPMNNVSGVSGAGYVWRRSMDYLTSEGHWGEPRNFSVPQGVIKKEICPVTGLLAGPACPHRSLEYFVTSLPLPSVCRHEELTQMPLGAAVPVIGRKEGFRISRPVNRELYAWDPGLAAEIQNIKAIGHSEPGLDEVLWLLNGREIKRQTAKGYQEVFCLVEVKPGNYRLELIGLSGGQETKRDSVNYRVKR